MASPARACYDSTTSRPALSRLIPSVRERGNLSRQNDHSGIDHTKLPALIRYT